MARKLKDRGVEFPVMSVSYFIVRYSSGLLDDNPPAWVAEVAKESPLWQGFVTSGQVELGVAR